MLTVIALRLGTRRQLDTGSASFQAEQRMAAVRAKVEVPFRWVKPIFGYVNVR